MVLNFCATTISLALTHERIPDKAPLPDFLLDNIQTRSWGLTASEIVLQVSQWIKQQLDHAFIKQWWFKIESIFNIWFFSLQVNVTMAIIVLIMHKHRFIILRRLALILGLLYGYRAITMFVTNLPKADPNYFCTAKVSHVSISNPIEMHFSFKAIKNISLSCWNMYTLYLQESKGLTFYEVLNRAFSILSGFGLSMNGKHVYCGDYIYSGHTMTIILAHLLIQVMTIY